MKAYLKGGPADGRVIPHPGITVYRVPIPKDNPAVQQLIRSDYAAYAIADYDIADYLFSGYARVDLDGGVRYMIYEFDRMSE